VTTSRLTIQNNDPTKSPLTVISQQCSRMTRLLTVINQPSNQKNSLLSKPINRRSKRKNSPLTPVKQ
jgi:hypothetical protein